MMHRALALAASLAVLAGCGGGGSKPAPLPAMSSPSPSAGALGTAKLTLHMPANFHHAAFPVTTKKITYKGKTRYVTVASTRRSPKYINPGTGNLIHVYGTPSGQDSTIEYTPGSGIALPSNASADGSQTISVGLPAQQYNYIEIQEKDPTNSNELAAGYVYGTVIAAGQPTSLQITMDMNAQYIALTTDPVNGADASVLSNSNFCVYTNQTKFYAFAADSTGGFVLPGSPAGGAFDDNNQGPAIPTPTLDGQYAFLVSTPLGMLTTFPGSGSSVNATFTETNPDLGGTTYAYTTIGNNGSAQCLLTGSFSEEPANVGDTVTMTISGGNAPYTATETDGLCTLTPTASSNTWTLVPQYTGSECQVTLGDANSGNTAYAYLDSNSLGGGPLAVSPGGACFTASNQVQTITISGGLGNYNVGAPSDASVFTIGNVTATSFDVTSGPNFSSTATVTVTDTGDSETSTFTGGSSQC